MRFRLYLHTSLQMCQSGQCCNRKMTFRWSASTVTPMQYSKLWSKMACIQKCKTIVPCFTGDTSRISLTNKLSKPFLRQCQMTVPGQRCFSRIINSGLRNSLRAVLSHFGKWEIPWSLRTSHEKYATSTSTSKHKRMSTRLRNWIRIIYLFTKL